MSVRAHTNKLHTRAYAGMCDTFAHATVTGTDLGCGIRRTVKASAKNEEETLGDSNHLLPSSAGQAKKEREPVGRGLRSVPDAPEELRLCPGRLHPAFLPQGERNCSALHAGACSLVRKHRLM